MFSFLPIERDFVKFIRLFLFIFQVGLWYGESVVGDGFVSRDKIKRQQLQSELVVAGLLLQLTSSDSSESSTVYAGECKLLVGAPAEMAADVSNGCRLLSLYTSESSLCSDILLVLRKEFFSLRIKDPFFAFRWALFVDKDRPSPLSSSIGVSSKAVTTVFTLMLDCDLLFRLPIRFHKDERGVAISLGVLGGISEVVMLAVPAIRLLSGVQVFFFALVVLSNSELLLCNVILRTEHLCSRSTTNRLFVPLQ